MQTFSDINYIIAAVKNIQWVYVKRDFCSWKLALSIGGIVLPIFRWYSASYMHLYKFLPQTMQTFSDINYIIAAVKNIQWVYVKRDFCSWKLALSIGGIVLPICIYTSFYHKLCRHSLTSTTSLLLWKIFSEYMWKEIFVAENLQSIYWWYSASYMYLYKFLPQTMQTFSDINYIIAAVKNIQWVYVKRDFCSWKLALSIGGIVLPICIYTSFYHKLCRHSLTSTTSLLLWKIFSEYMWKEIFVAENLLYLLVV